MPSYESRAESYTTEVVEQINKLTRMLCHVMGQIELFNAEKCVNLNNETKEWWEIHKKFDRALAYIGK